MAIQIEEMTHTVRPITRETFKPYAKLGKSNTKIQGRICDLLFRLVQTDDPAKVEQVCSDEIVWLEGENYGAATRTSYVSAYRKAIQAYFDVYPPTSSALMSERETVKGTITLHIALNFLLAAPADYAQSKAKVKSKTAKQRDNLTGFDAASAVLVTEEALESEDWRELAAGLIMATQSRPSDMLSSGQFKALSKYRLEFTSCVKKRGRAVTGEIFCLVESVTFIDAFSRLRRMPEVMEMKSWALKEIDSGKNSSLNRAVKRVYGEVIPAPYGEKQLSCKNLRAAGVNAAYWLHGRDNQSLGRFAELQLLHDNPGVAANYEDFYAADGDGTRLREAGIYEDDKLMREPKSEQRSSVSVDAQLRDMIGDSEQWGEGSQADRLERIIARALQADKLEAQLVSEREQRQKLEVELKRLLHIQRLKRGLLPMQPGQEEYEIIKIDVNNANGFDWRTVSNDELNGDRRNDAYKEKLRRSVEALQEYNAGLDLSEQYAINTSILRQLTGVTPRLIKEWMDERKAELDSYTNAQGHNYRQNVGKPDAKSVIKWSEVAYGAYDW